MAVTFQTEGMESPSTDAPKATAEQNIDFWRSLHSDNAYFDQHRWYTDRLRPFGLERIERNLQLESSDALLEIGCGYGRLLWHLAPKVRKTIGIDLAQEPLDEAGKLLEGRGSVQFVRGDGLSVQPVETESVTAAYAFTVFQHMSRDVARANTTDIARVLQPGGRFLLQLHVGDGSEDVQAVQGEQSIGYTAEQAASLVESAGLTIKSISRDLLLEYYPEGNVAWWWVLATKSA